MKYLELPISTHPLSASEKVRWLDALDALLRYAGAPGDWGYESKLGLTTDHLHKLRAEIRHLET